MMLFVIEEGRRSGYSVSLTGRKGTCYHRDRWHWSSDGRLLVQWGALQQAHIPKQPDDPSEVREGFAWGYAWCDVQALAVHRGWPPVQLLDTELFTERIEVIVPVGFFEVSEETRE